MNILGILGTVATIIVFFTSLVVFHELGHFLLAKACKMRVEEFSVGFWKRIVRIGFDGQTEYNIRALPIGGYVRIAGMEIEDSVERRLTGAEDDRVETTNERLLDQETAEVSGVDPDGFNSRPIYQRFLVILAGPVFSFLFGWLVLCIVGVTAGVPDKSLFTISQVTAHSVAATAGLHANDTVLAINGKPVDYDQTFDIIRGSINKPLSLTVRDDHEKQRTIAITPASAIDSESPKPIGRIGVMPYRTPVTFKHVSLAESFKLGSLDTEFYFVTMFDMIKSGDIKNNVGGPVAIVSETNQATKHGGFETLGILGQLSLSLGFFNLFPIPILDGGHILLMAVEVIRRKKLNADQTIKVSTAGLAILGLLFVLIFIKDITGLFHHG